MKLKKPSLDGRPTGRFKPPAASCDSALTAKKPNLGYPGWVIASAVLIFIISQLAAAIIIEGVLLLVSSSAHRSPIKYNDSTTAQFSFVLLSALLYIILVRWVLKRRGLGWWTIGLGRRPVWRDLKRAVLAFLVLIALVIIINLLLSAVSPDINQQRQDLGFKNPQDASGYTLAFAALVIVPAITEEILIRGYLYSGLRYWWAVPQAAVATSILFALPHLFEGNSALLWSAAADTFILSFILIYLREKTGALYSGMLVHGFNNFLAFGVYFQGLILLR